MKVFIVLLGLTLINADSENSRYSRERPERSICMKDLKKFIQKNSKLCLADTGATEDDLNDILNNVRNPSKESKCLRYCLMKQFMMINLDNELSKKGVVGIAKQFAGSNSPDIVKVAAEIADICAQKKVKDDCESAHRYARCIFREIKLRKIPLPN